MRASSRRPLTLLPILVTALVPALWTPPACAQPGSGHWELNLHAAALRPGLFDESAEALQFGGRLAHNFGNGLFLGATFDRARSADVTLTPVGGLAATLLLYGAELGFQTYLSPRWVFLLVGGAGAATVSIDAPPPGVVRSSTGLLIPFGMGWKVHNSGLSPSWAFRFDLRDNMILLEQAGADGSVTNEPRHNPELSLGFSFLFGGGVPAPQRDTDRDGVPDSRDRCLNRPGKAVDARGCPLEPEEPPAIDFGARARADEDGDGVPDVDDGCLGTLPGIPVKPDGCPAPPPAAVAPPAPGDADGDGVPDERDQCPNSPTGLDVDDRGCLARPEPTEAEPPQAGEIAEPGARPQPSPGAGPRACIEAAAETIEFDGRRFRALGFPQEVDWTFLAHVGDYDEVPLYVSRSAEPPFDELWVPRCGEGDLFDLFVAEGANP
jgi:hypothetical protein